MSRAGSRIDKYKKPVGVGRLPDDKIALLVTAMTRQISGHAYDPKTFDEVEEVEPGVTSEPGDNIVILIPIAGRRPLAWNLSGMTTEELEATRQFFNFLFDLADPIVRERDKVAKDAFEKGDDSYARIYRQVPQIVTRKRAKSSNGESVQERPVDTPDGPGSELPG